MSKRGDSELLLDIKEAIRRISDYTGELDYDEFLGEEKTQDAVIRNLEIIGEASKNLSLAIKNKCDNIPWKEMAGLRDRLIHQYFGVNIDTVWKIIRQELPGLLAKIKNIRQ